MFPENIEAFRVFWSLRSQWEYPGADGGRCTVPFAELDVVIRRVVGRLRRRKECFLRVTVMLLAARQVFLERYKVAASKRAAGRRK